MRLRRASPFALTFCIVATSSFALSTEYRAGSGGVVLRADVPMGSVVGTGDRVSFEYQTREDAVVLVFNIDSQGYVHLLHPTGSPELSQARRTYRVPATGADLVVDTQTGVEFVFALAVDDPSAIDATEIDRLRAADAGSGAPYRIDGDPFVAANMIAGELVRGVSHRAAYFGYTYFYVNQRVDYPCYLCGACDGVADDDACTDYRVVQNFDRRSPLAYPLRRAYETVGGDVDVAASDAPVVAPEGSDVDVNFYPYGVEARAIDPFYTSLWNDVWWYDPFYWHGPYYPYYAPGWSFRVGLGWGWGWSWWGGYYCSGWYAPWWGYYPWHGYYRGYPGGAYDPPAKFKAKYKSGSSSLTKNRAVAQRDGDLRIASKDVRRSLSKHAQAPSRAKTKSTFVSNRDRANAGPGARVKTSVGGRSGAVKAAPRSKGTTPRVKATPRGRGATPSVKSAPRTSNPGRRSVSNVPRGHGGAKYRADAPGSRAYPRSGSAGMGRSHGPAPRMKGTSSSSYRAPSRGAATRSSAPRPASSRSKSR